MIHEYIDIRIKLIFSLCHYDYVVMSSCHSCEPGLRRSSSLRFVPRRFLPPFSGALLILLHASKLENELNRDSPHFE